MKVEKGFQTETINDEPVQFEWQDAANTNETEANQELDTVTLQNLTVTNINGDDFDIFIKQLCLTNIKCYIPGDLKINGVREFYENFKILLNCPQGSLNECTITIFRISPLERDLQLS